MRWHTKPIMQLVVMFAVMVAIVGVQRSATLLLAGNTINSTASVREQKDSTIRKVAGGCSYRAGGAIQTGQTETNPQNANPRWPISDPRYRGEYDVLNSQYFIQQANNDSRYLGYIDDGPAPEGYVIGMLGSMFGYKPNRFIAAYDMKYVDPYGQGIRGNDPSDIKGDYPILQIPVPADKEVLMASTRYDIGGGEAMVVFADANRVVLHIGRHEYFVGTGSCLNGPCSGGYWIYLSDVCVNDNIVEKYNSVKAAQEAAGPNLDPIELPIVPEGYPLGRALGTSVKLALRDNGPFILMNKPGLWQGYPEQNFGTTTTPPLTPPNSPVPTNPTTPPSTPRPTAPTTPQPTTSPRATGSPAPTTPPRTQSVVIPVRVGQGITIDCPGKVRIKLQGVSTIYENAGVANLTPGKFIPVTIRDVPFAIYPDIDVEYVSSVASHAVYAEMNTNGNSQLVIDGTSRPIAERVIDVDKGVCNPIVAPPTGGANTEFRLTVARACNSDVCTYLKDFISQVSTNPANMYVGLLWQDNTGLSHTTDGNALATRNTNVHLSLYFKATDSPSSFPGITAVQSASVQLGVGPDSGYQYIQFK